MLLLLQGCNKRLTGWCPDGSLHGDDDIHDQYQVQEIGDSKQSPPTRPRAIGDAVVKEGEAGLVGVYQTDEDDGRGQYQVPGHGELCTREHRVCLPPLLDSEDIVVSEGERKRQVTADITIFTHTSKDM